MAVLGLRFCVRAFSSCGERGSLFIAVRGPLTIAASLVAEQRLQTRRLSSCGSRAQWLHGMWDLPRPGLEPVSPALAGRFSTTAPPGKPWYLFLKDSLNKSTSLTVPPPGRQRSGSPDVHDGTGEAMPEAMPGLTKPSWSREFKVWLPGGTWGALPWGTWRDECGRKGLLCTGKLSTEGPTHLLR